MLTTLVDDSSAGGKVAQINAEVDRLFWLEVGPALRRKTRNNADRWFTRLTALRGAVGPAWACVYLFDRQKLSRFWYWGRSSA